MNKFFVICTVDGIDYLTDVPAESAAGAEHKILDLSICGRHTYAVTGAQAFDYNDIKLTYFSDYIQKCECISFGSLAQIIEDVNAIIRKKDSVELAIERKTKQLKELTDELAKLKYEAKDLGINY